MTGSLSANVPVDITQFGAPSQTHDHSSGLYPPGRAIDGDLTTFSHTESQSPGAAWELDFGIEREIARVEIVTRDCCAGRLNGATLRLSDSEAEEVFEVAIVDSGPLSLFGADIPAGTVARRVRIGFEPGESGIVHLAEVRVFAPAGAPPDIATFVATPHGNGALLHWEVRGADSVEFDGSPVAANGSTVVDPAESRSYLLAAANACATVGRTVAVIVDGVPLLPRINELAAFPEDGPDWIEIWNPGIGTADLTGWHLTDDPDDLTRWRFPVGANVGRDAFLVVEEPFGLAREAGSYVALVDAEGNVVSEFTYPEQFAGSSYGIDRQGNAIYFLEPSPGGFNHGPTTEGFLAGVAFSAERGFYDAPFTVELAPMTAGATVLYSVDGSDPATPYAGPIDIATTTVIRAIETAPGTEPSRSMAHTYLFLNDVASQPEFPQGVPADWQPASAAGALAPIPRRSDFEMDPDIVGDAPFTDREDGMFGVADALRSLPSMCLTLPAGEMWDPDDGLHANALKRGRMWERAISMEILDPEAGDHFRTGCGLRIHGGRGRVAEMLKKSFRLYFRGDYGATKFEYPLFEGMPDGGIDHLVLRGGNGKTWASPWRDLSGGGNSLPRVTYLRDPFHRGNHRAMGNPAFAGTFVHLYINGLYWGLYNSVERPGGPFASNHFGGDHEDYDFLKWANGLPPQVLNGDLEAWNELMTLARSDPLGNWEAIRALLDVDSLADYLIANFYVGNIDWVRNNAYAFRPRPPLGDGRFRFMVWDGEEILLSVSRNSTGGSGNNADTGLELHDRLRASVPEYRLGFADRIHRHMIDEDGSLLPDAATARHDALVAIADHAIPAESARWGDLLRPKDPYTHGGDWLAEIANITDNYLPRRTSISFGHMRDDALYPDTEAPVVTLQADNTVAVERPHGQGGVAYFTLDGSDPRLPGGAVSPSAMSYDPQTTTTALVANADWRYLDDGSALDDGAWTQVGFGDNAWTLGQSPLGYGGIFGVTLQTAVGFGPDFLDKYITTYFRHRFEVSGLAALPELELRLLRDDGAVVYLNGREVVRSNIEEGTPVTSGTLALSGVDGANEAVWHSFPIDPAHLHEGTNVLAVEVHQSAGNSSDMGFDLALVASVLTNGGTPVVLAGDATVRARILDGGEWSALEEESYVLGDPREDLVVSEIMYHPADPSPEEIAAGFSDDDAFEYIEIRNAGAGERLLDGMRFAKGVDVALSGTLAPGAFGLVVANSEAFEMRYGAGHPVIAEWEAGDRLDNGGERIKLVDGADGVLREFRYDDALPWPTGPDGGGFSLVLISPFANPDHALAKSWRSSGLAGGNPGESDRVRYVSGDLVGYALDGGLRVSGDTRSIAIERRIAAEDAEVVVEWSMDLESWTELGAVPVSREATKEGVETITWILPEGDQGYVRVRVNLL